MTKPVALITGASAGIGVEFARQLARRGFDLILVARRADRLAEVAESLKPARVETLVADLATDEGIARTRAKIEGTPPLEVLVNNAGFGTKGRFADADFESQDRMHRLHVMATLHLTHAALRGMVARNRGAIINVASVAGFTHSAGSTSYNSTKHWINAFTEGIYLELLSTSSQVRIQALCPGFTYSEFHDVLGMDRGAIPKSLWLSAERVVRESLEGLESNRLYVIPDWRYRMLVRLYPWIPRSVRHWAAIRAGRRMKRDAESH